jgi:hypothetical protein
MKNSQHTGKFVLTDAWIVDAADFPLIEADVDENILELNPSAQKLFNVSSSKSKIEAISAKFAKPGEFAEILSLPKDSLHKSDVEIFSDNRILIFTVVARKNPS